MDFGDLLIYLDAPTVSKICGQKTLYFDGKRLRKAFFGSLEIEGSLRVKIKTIC